MQAKRRRFQEFRSGSVLVLVLISLAILIASGVGLMTVSYGVRWHAIRDKNEAVAMLAAEAGYEKAIFRMSQQPDMLSALEDDDFSSSETMTLVTPDEPGYDRDEDEETGTCDYTISLDSFAGCRPVFRVRSTGHCGVFDRTVDVYVIQAISGWDMGMCRVPSGFNSTTPVYYVTGEVLDIPIHINSYGDPEDSHRDIHISGFPDFQQMVSVSEARYSAGGSIDKYGSVMSLFDEGIYFQQPNSRITDGDSLQRKIDHFKETLQSKKPRLIFTPKKDNDVTNGLPAVQLEFFVNNKGRGKIRITDNCTVRGYKRGGSSKNTYDYRIDQDHKKLMFEKYHIYGYHYIPEDAVDDGQRITKNVSYTYVTPEYGGISAEKGGQIFVDGNVIIGGKKTRHNNNQLVKGRITVVATGNIWVADSIFVDGEHDADGMPTLDNPNILGLIAQGVVKVVNPGQVEGLGGPAGVDDAVYEPIGVPDSGQGNNSHHRYLPRYTTVEASITVGGGGWGAENVRRRWYGGRKEAPGGQNYIVVHGTISEAVRGVVGAGSDGYVKRYYLDERLLEGILPGDIWLKGKYIPAPAGWHDYRPQI